MVRSAVVLAFSVSALTVQAQARPREPQELDRSRPVPRKSEVLDVWQRRQATIHSFSADWVETQAYPTGWVANPRYPERERLALPSLRRDRVYTISKSLTVTGDQMRYGFEVDRPEEADGVRVTSDRGNDGLGVHRHYTYASAFDGRETIVRQTTSLDSPPLSVTRFGANWDAQNLDMRAVLMAFRPLHPAMGHLLMDRAVTNGARTFYRGKSTFLLEEQHDPSGWKTILRIEPERDFLISEFLVLFEQNRIIDIDIDYTQDARWGWVPSGWRVTEMLADG